MNALKLTSKMIAALMLSATMGGCAVATGTGEETEEHTSASASAESKAASEARPSSTAASGTTAESATSATSETVQVGNNGGGVAPDPNPQPWEPPTVSTARGIGVPSRPMPKSQALPQ